MNHHGGAAYSARTMDWRFDSKTNIMFTPRGLDMDGGCGHHLPQAERCKKWSSKYWSITSSINEWLSTKISNFTATNFSYDEDGATDGINEAGLGVHLLYLGGTGYSDYSPLANGVTYSRWVRYLLDTCATVAEAKAAMRDTPILGVGIGGPAGIGLMGAHLALEDRSGDSVIFEFVAGALQQYPKDSDGPNAGFGRDFRVLTNDPPLPQQIANRNRFMKAQADGKLSLSCEEIQPGSSAFNDKDYPNRCLPGDITSRDRFARLSYFLDYLDGTGKQPHEIAAELRAVLFSAVEPPGAPDLEPGSEMVCTVLGQCEVTTYWYTVTDYGQNLYYFGKYADLNTVFIDLNNDLLRNSKEIMYLRAPGFPLSGDVTSKLLPQRDQRPTFNTLRSMLSLLF